MKTGICSTTTHYGRAVGLCLIALLSGCDESADLSGTSAGQTVEIRYGSGAAEYRALVHVPASVDPATPVPVVVSIHGCNQSAELQQRGTLLDEITQRERFIVVYPDFVDDNSHPLACWRFYLPTEWNRDQGDAAGVAGLTRRVMERWSVDAERVYVIGQSSGAFLTSILGAAYPDLYTAMGNLAGGPYASTFLDAANPLIPALANPALQAQLAFRAMGTHARVIPLLQIHGDADTTIYPQNGANAVQQWLMTNNLVASGGLSGVFPLTPSETKSHDADQAFPYEVDDYRSADGCLVARHIRIQGLQHLYPGGPDDREMPAFVEPLAMSASEAAWAFFKPYRKSTTPLPCG